MLSYLDTFSILGFDMFVNVQMFPVMLLICAYVQNNLLKEHCNDSYSILKG